MTRPLHLHLLDLIWTFAASSVAAAVIVTALCWCALAGHFTMSVLMRGTP